MNTNTTVGAIIIVRKIHTRTMGEARVTLLRARCVASKNARLNVGTQPALPRGAPPRIRLRIQPHTRSYALLEGRDSVMHAEPRE